jgi:hypothetical protein
MTFARAYYARWRRYIVVRLGWWSSEQSQHFACCNGTPALVLIVLGRVPDFIACFEWG